MGHGMWRLVKAMVFLLILAALGLVAYAYLGPLLGADFSADSREIKIPVELDAN